MIFVSLLGDYTICTGDFANCAIVTASQELHFYSCTILTAMIIMDPYIMLLLPTYVNGYINCVCMYDLYA